MKLNLKDLYRFTRIFGKKAGFQLYNRFKRNKLSNLYVPELKQPITLRSGSSDIKAFFQIFIQQEYRIKFMDNPKIIIDGGANIGLFTVLMKNKFPSSKIISIEPDIENFAALQNNVKGYDNISCENCGLWNTTTNLKIYDKFELGKWGMVVEESKEEGRLKALSINDIMQKYNIERIDILKLDIETSEKKLFLDNYESWLPRTKMIIIELHDWVEEGCAKPFFIAINKTFKNYKYLIQGENTIIINNDIE